MHNKGKNGKDLTDKQDIKKGWQEYTEELYKKILHNPDNHDGVMTHLEPDILAEGLSRVFSNTTVQKRQFFGAQLSSQFTKDN